MYTFFRAAAVALGFALFLSACNKEENTPVDPTSGLSKITEGYAAGASARVQVYAEQPALTTGYTRFFLVLTDSITGNRIEDAHITLTPMMDMGAMQHSAPYENPVSETPVNGLYPCSVTFVMSSMGGSWTVRVSVHNHANGKSGVFSFPVTVNEPSRSRQKSFTAAHNGSKYFISLIHPANPKVGINDFEIAVYKRASMMSWPADSSLSVIITPEMPTMGHGSPNNVNPVHTGNGHYKGKVNFTMTGYWKVNLDFWSGASVADSTQYFDIEF